MNEFTASLNQADTAPIITWMRESRRFARIAAALTVGFFLFTFYSPGALAVKEAIEKEQAKNQFHAQGKTDDEKLSYTLQSIKEHVAERKAALKQRVAEESTLWQDLLNLIGLSELTSEDLDQLESMAGQAEQLHQKALESFNQTEEQLKEKGLPETILERHRKTVEKYKAEYRNFRNALRQLRESGSLQDQAEAMDALDGFLKKQQFKRSQQPFDPDKLPFGTPDPKKTRQPATDKQKLNELLGLNKHPGAGEQFLDAVVSPAYAQISNQPAPADLEETIDVQITEAIQAKADELNNDPVAIYNWVRNNIEFLPTYGSIQGSDMTLQTLRGNPFDTASLLIALLRASDIPARYAYGTVRIPVDKVMNWVGGVEVPEAAMSILGQGGIPNTGQTQGGRITHIKLEHVWVEAWVDYMPSRGAMHVEGDTWIPMDASFKQYEYTDGVDVQDQVPFDAENFADTIVDSATIDEDAGTVQGIDQQYIQDQLSQYQTQVEQFIDTQHPEATVGEVIGTKTIRQESRPILAAGLPYNQLATSERFSTIPDNLRHKYRFRLQDRYGSPLFSEVLDLPAIANSTLALSFSPATEADEQALQSFVPENITDITQLPDSIPGYLVNVEAQLVIDRQEQNTGVVQVIGEEVTLSQALYDPQDGWEATDTTVVAGEYHAIRVSGVGNPIDLLDRVASNAQVVQESLKPCQQDGVCGAVDRLSKHQITGVLLQAGLLSWFSSVDSQNRLISTQQNITYQILPSYGKFGTSANVQYSWGVPKLSNFTSVSMDVDRYKILAESKDNSFINRVNFVKFSGSMGSTYEHVVPERLLSTHAYPVQAVSAIKIINFAISQGQRVFTITKDNMDNMSNITINPESREEIRNAVMRGKQVTVHEKPVGISGWTGSGYIYTDQNTGSGAYKISGGFDGGKAKIRAPFSKLLFNFGVADVLIKKVASKLGFFIAVENFVRGMIDIVNKCGNSVGVFIATLVYMAIFFATLSIVTSLTAGIAGFLLATIISELIAVMTRLINNMIARTFC